MKLAAVKRESKNLMETCLEQVVSRLESGFQAEQLRDKVTPCHNE